MIRERVTRWGPYLAACAVGLSFVFFCLAGVYTIRQQQYVNERLCQQAVANRDATREAWIAARLLVLAAEDDHAERDRMHSFFAGVLRSIPSLECADGDPQPRRR